MRPLSLKWVCSRFSLTSIFQPKWNFQTMWNYFHVIKQVKLSLKAYSWVWRNFNWKPFENDEICFSFHVKSSFLSWDIYSFVLTFWLCRKRTCKRELYLISKIHNITDQTPNNLQYTYYPISQEVKVIRQWTLVS